MKFVSQRFFHHNFEFVSIKCNIELGTCGSAEESEEFDGGSGIPTLVWADFEDHPALPGSSESSGTNNFVWNKYHTATSDDFYCGGSNYKPAVPAAQYYLLEQMCGVECPAGLNPTTNGANADATHNGCRKI